MCGDIKGLQPMTRKRIFLPAPVVPASTVGYLAEKYRNLRPELQKNRLICQAAELGADRNHQHDAAGIGQIFGVVAKGRRQRADLVSPIGISSAA